MCLRTQLALLSVYRLGTVPCYLCIDCVIVCDWAAPESGMCRIQHMQGHDIPRTPSFMCAACELCRCSCLTHATGVFVALRKHACQRCQLLHVLHCSVQAPFPQLPLFRVMKLSLKEFYESHGSKPSIYDSLPVRPRCDRCATGAVQQPRRSAAAGIVHCSNNSIQLLPSTWLQVFHLHVHSQAAGIFGWILKP